MTERQRCQLVVFSVPADGVDDVADSDAAALSLLFPALSLLFPALSLLSEAVDACEEEDFL
jgi:hypothetical protein